MEYLGTYTICPNNADIEVQCYGFIEPAQRETLEQEGLSEYANLESVKHGDIEIIDYIPQSELNKLQTLINEK